MYGKEALDNSQIIKYGLTQEFFLAFHHLTYRDIELPLTLIFRYHLIIQPYINKNLYNLALINKLQKKYKFHTIADVQKSLPRNPKTKINLAKEKKRKALLINASLAKFTLDKYKDSKVIVLVQNRKERSIIKGLKFPKNFKIIDIDKECRRIKLSPKTVKNTVRLINYLVKKNSKQKIFGNKFFERWLINNSLDSMRLISVLDNIITKYPIGIIMDIVEYSNKGTIQALLAKKYNLPFINIPQDLISDMSLIPTRASHYFVWGKNYKNWLVKRGIDTKKIKVVGNLRFEYQNTKSTISRAKLCRSLKIPTSNYIIAFTSQSFPQKVNIEIIKWINHTITRLAKSGSVPVTFIIKPHPSDHLGYSKFQKKKRLVLLPRRFKLYDLLNNADFIMTISSTTAIEAAKLKKGIIVLQPKIPYLKFRNTNNFNAHLAKASAGTVVYNQKQLYQRIEKIIHDENFRKGLISQGQKFLTNSLYTKRGTTTSDQVKTHIDKIIEK